MQKNIVGCTECAFLRECGGLSEQNTSSWWGCFSHCLTECNAETCDLACPHNLELFAHCMVEIGGNVDFSAPSLHVPRIRLPEYVTKIHNGSGRSRKLSAQVVAVPIREVLRISGSNMSCRFETSTQLRQYFKLSDSTRFIISCISVDGDVEKVWSGLKYGGLAKELARLKPAAVIVPNFSFFIDDVPRTHTLYNRKRICLAAQNLSDAGCRVILPLNALTSNDWDFWRKLLEDNPAMKYIGKEFQTGLSNPIAGKQAIEHLARLQERLKRPLHPVALGAGIFSNIFETYFDNYTIIDSRPFMLAVNRQQLFKEASGLYSEVSSPTAPGEPIDDLLEVNLRERKNQLKSGCG